MGLSLLLFATAMIMAYKVSLKNILASIVAITLCVMTVQSRNPKFPLSAHLLKFHADTSIPAKEENNPVDKKLKSQNDSLPGKIVAQSDSLPSRSTDSLLAKDSSKPEFYVDSTLYSLSKSAPDTVITYTADDSMVVDIPGQTITLYGEKANTQYKNNNLTAPVIELQQTTGDIIAAYKKDSTGKVIEYPTYKQGDFLSESDSIKFNMKTGKGFTIGTYTQQGDMYVHGQVIKKVNSDVFYVYKGQFTTCDLDTPHFAFVSNKIKFINDKMAITGPVHPEFEGVPIPVYFPFGIFPIESGRHSGLLEPTFTSSQQRGLGLENLGYYKVINDYWDIVFRGSIYSYGGWSFSLSPTYYKRYHYRGNLEFDIQNFNTNFKGDPDFSHNRSYHLAWSHSMDSKARPGVSFSANVNAASSSYNSQVPNSPLLNYSNQLSSSIAFSKTWQDKPFNLTITANHNQNTNLKIINVNLPDVNFNVQTIYPFRKKEEVGKPKWYENIGIGYSGNAKSQFSFYDTLPDIFRQIVDTFQYGAQHSIPISLSLPEMGVFQVGPSVSYNETWYQTKTIHSWDPVRDTLVTTVQKGFYTARQMTFGVNVSTRIFGMITPKKKKSKLIGIRHEITPTLGLNYKPDLNRNSTYYTQVDTAGDLQQFSKYERNIFSPYSGGRFGGITFSLDNNISMKVRNSGGSGADSVKKINLIDGLSLSTAYNLISDSFQLSPFNVSARSSLFNNKINITANGVLDPYDVNDKGQRINKLLWDRKPLSFGRLTTGSVSISSSLRGGNKDENKKSELTSGDNYYTGQGYTQDQYNNELTYIQNNPSQFADFNIPWSVNFSYALTFSKIYVLNNGFSTSFSQNVNFGGTLGLTKKWQLAANGYYNITQGQVNSISLTISRDLHCWQMSISVAPVGLYRFFSINISPKSPLLRDLRVSRTRYFYNNL